MTDVNLLVPVGNHFFTPEALQAAAAKALKDLPDGHTSAITGGVDSKGVETAIAFNSKDGHFTATAAWQHDWSGNDTFGALGRWSF